MPCYTQWDAYLKRGSDEYRKARSELQAKLKAVLHVIDYYYQLHRFAVPPATRPKKALYVEMAHLEYQIEARDLGGIDEQKVIKQIIHHMICDEIHFTTLYDVSSLLRVNDPRQCGYRRVILICANEIRRRL